MTIYRHISGVKVSDEFSPDRKHRYWLEIEHINNRPKTVCAIMENPSYAYEEIADKSVQFLERLVFEKNYREFEDVGKLVVVNLFSYVQTKDFQGGLDKFDVTTDTYLRKGVNQGDIMLLAWGRTANYPERIAGVKAMIRESGKTEEVYATKKHPSRGSYKDFIVKVDDI